MDEKILELLEQKQKEYQAAYEKHIGLANANHGALEAIDELIQTIKEQGAGESQPLSKKG